MVVYLAQFPHQRFKNSTCLNLSNSSINWTVGISSRQNSGHIPDQRNPKRRVTKRIEAEKDHLREPTSVWLAGIHLGLGFDLKWSLWAVSMNRHGTQRRPILLLLFTLMYASFCMYVYHCTTHSRYRSCCKDQV